MLPQRHLIDQKPKSPALEHYEISMLSIICPEEILDVTEHREGHMTKMMSTQRSVVHITWPAAASHRTGREKKVYSGVLIMPNWRCSRESGERCYVLSALLRLQ